MRRSEIPFSHIWFDMSLRFPSRDVQEAVGCASLEFGTEN